jgi:hypothetical protein
MLNVPFVLPRQLQPLVNRWICFVATPSPRANTRNRTPPRTIRGAFHHQGPTPTQADGAAQSKAIRRPGRPHASGDGPPQALVDAPAGFALKASCAARSSLPGRRQIQRRPAHRGNHRLPPQGRPVQYLRRCARWPSGGSQTTAPTYAVRRMPARTQTANEQEGRNHSCIFSG